MLSDVIRNIIARQPDMEVIGEVLDPIELLLTVKARPVDVVIVTPLEAEGEPPICRHLLAQQPLLRIMTLQAMGEAAFLYESGTPKKRLDEPSEQSILNAIRESTCLITG